MNDALPSRVSRILGPIVRLLIARGLRIPDLYESLKRLYVEQADQHFRIDGKRLTDSRISVLTGLQRRDVKRLRREAPESSAASMGPVPRVISAWISHPDWQDDHGNPSPLPRKGSGKNTFDALVAQVSRDIHPRTVLDALLETGSASLDETGGTVSLNATAYVPRDEATLETYLANNVGDHLEAGVGNILAAPDAAPFFERAAHFNNLSPASLDTLDEQARILQSDALQQIASLARELQETDATDDTAVGRFRCGAFIYLDSKPPNAPGQAAGQKDQPE